MKFLFSAAFFCIAIGVTAAPVLDNPALNKVRFQTAPKHAPLQFVKNGKADFIIAYDKNAESHLSHPAWKSIEPAVKILQENIAKTTGTAPEAVDISEAKRKSSKYLLLVGESALTKELGIKAADLPQEGFIVKSFPGGVAIVGNDSSIDRTFNSKGPLYMKGARRATLWGAYDFLERFFECRFYYPGPDGSVHPETKELIIPPFCYMDAPYFQNRGTHYLQIQLPHIRRSIQNVEAPDLEKYYTSQRWSKTEPFTSMHSPYPEKWAKSNSDKIESSFFRNGNGHLYYSQVSHASNYFDVTNLNFADNLIDSLKRFYASGGKEQQGWAYNNGYYIVFGQCDNELQLPEMQSNPTVQQEKLITRENLSFGQGAYFSDIYGRFYRYLAERIKKEFPDKKLIIMPYASYTHAPFQKKYYLPDNVEAGVCLGKFPRFIRNPKVCAEYQDQMNHWYEALGKRPVQMLWTYNAGNNCFVQAIATQLLGEIPKVLGKLLGNMEIFHEFSMWPKPFPDLGHWHFYYATYAGMRAMWNPDFDVDAALDEHWDLFYGAEAGIHLKEMHRILKESFFKYAVPAQNSKALYPPKVLDRLEQCMKDAERCLKADSVERRRYDLMSRALKFELKSQRGQHAYNLPLYPVRRLPDNAEIVVDGKGDEPEWKNCRPVPMLEPNGTGEIPRFPADLRLFWNEKGIYGKARMPYPPKTGNKDMWQNSVVELFFSPGLEKKMYFQFGLDPENRKSMMKQQLKPFIMARDYKWEYPGFRSASVTGENEWTLEFFLPFSGITDKIPEAYSSWHFNFVNNKASEPRETSASSMCLGNNHNINLHGIIKFMGKGE